MGPDNDSNGHRPPDLTFGDAPGNVLTHDYAEAVLRLFWKYDRELFSARLGEAITGAKPKATRSRA